DESSMLVSEVLNVKPNMTVLDSCSAPGGKATHIAEMMQDKGHLVAHDLHKNKIKLVQNHAKRLNLSIIEASPLDARNLTNKYEEAVNLLKKDGELVYSTCTVNKLENNHVIKTFLNKHPDFEVESNFIDSLPQSVIESSQITDYGIQLFPYTINSDAFFITKLKYKQ